jgi:hypothetical protein
MTQKRKPAKHRAKKRATAREYVMPKTAAELGFDCAICHAPAVWFDYGRARKDHRAGLVCDDHPAIGNREKLLVKSEQGIGERCAPGCGANQRPRL